MKVCLKALHESQLGIEYAILILGDDVPARCKRTGVQYFCAADPINSRGLMDMAGDTQMGLFLRDELADGRAANRSSIDESIKLRRIGRCMTDHNLTRSRWNIGSRLLQDLPQYFIRIF